MQSSRGTMSKNKQGCLREPGNLIDLVLTWSIEDMLNETLFIENVKNIPETFLSIEHYFESYSSPLIEETRADLCSCLEIISNAPYAEILSIKESDMKSEISYCLEVDVWKNAAGLGGQELYNPKPGDILVLSNMKPESVDDLNRHGKFYAIASIAKVGIDSYDEVEENGDSQDVIEIRVSNRIEVMNDSGGFRFAVFVRNIITNNRIWKALRMPYSITEYMSIIKEVLDPKPLEEGKHIKCSCKKPGGVLSEEDLCASLDSFNLNNSQIDAVFDSVSAIQCKHSHPVKLIWGPPGTGKTKIISTLLWVLTKKNCGALICAPTNVAIVEVALRFLRLIKESCRQVTENGSSIFSLGDFVLYGNMDQLKVDDDDLAEIVLDHRVDRLLECFSPLTGWRYRVISMIDFLENCLSQYQIFLEIRTENDSVKFSEFFISRFKTIAKPLVDCLKRLWAHLPRNSIPKNSFENLCALLCMLESFESFCSIGDAVYVALEQLHKISKDMGDENLNFPPENVLRGGGLFESSMGIEFCEKRTKCLLILQVLHRTVNLPRTTSRRYLEKFCLQHVSLIFCTASNSYKLRYFDIKAMELLIIDEAAQLKECELLIPLRLDGLQKAILIGDECQLPAMVKSKAAEEVGFGRSLFKRLSSLGHPKHLLNMQYRMHPSISFFPNVKFYNNQILDGPNVTCTSYGRNYLPGRMYGSYSFINITDGREELDEVGHSKKNMVEVAVVMQIVRSLFKAVAGSGQRLSIGVISPYSAQVDALQEKLLDKYETNGDFSVRVKSIDGFQGGEEDVIILSTVRSNSTGSVGFVSSHNRTNVALTRAKYALWILGNGLTLSRSESVWEELVHNAKKRGCFFNADEDNGLSKAIFHAKQELSQLDDLLKEDSVLFNNARWKVLFSDDFKKSFTKLKSIQVRKAIIRSLLRLADGWRPKKMNLDFLDGNSLQLINHCRIQGMHLIWTVDVVKNLRYIQVLKIWDILLLTEIPKLVKRLDNIFPMYTDIYIERCKVKCFEGKLEVPMSWRIGQDFIRYKNLTSSTEIKDEGRIGEVETRDCMEKSKVSESLLLMKFYSLSSGIVNQLLTASDGKEIDLPFEVTDQEMDIIRFPRSTFILGRSGTGKTTVLTMKLVQKEQQHYLSSQGLFDAKNHMSEVVCQRKELEKNDLLKDNISLHQIFVTVSPKLCSAIKSHILRLKSFISGGNFSNCDTSLDMHDVSDSLSEFKDIPDNFADIPQKHYPLVITFQKFLMILDGSMTNSFFDKFQDIREICQDRMGISKSLSLQAFIRRKEVNYEHFDSFYWPHFNSQLTKRLDSSMVFTQIISHIKGGSGGAYDRKLDRKDYVMLSEGRVSTLGREKREKIYDIFLDYETKKLMNGEFDLSDLVIDLHHRLRHGGYMGEKVDFIYVDEVQDLTMRQIALFKYLSNNFQEGFVFAGDTAQTIARGIDFRFQDIRSLFYKEFLLEQRSGCNDKVSMSDNFHLNQNFRTHDGVLKLAQSVVVLLYCFFPLSVDVLSPETSLIYGEQPVLLDPGTDENVIITIFGNSGNIGGGVSDFGAEQAILVRDDSDKSQIFDQVGKQALVLTIVECKGLEFQDVLLYNFFGASPLKNQWRVIYEYMKNQNLLDSKNQKSFPSFDMDKHSVLCSELKQLYVAITRTRQRLWICETVEEYSGPMFDYWKKLGLVQVRHLDSSLAQAMRVASSPEEWKKRGIKLFNEGNYEMATMCFERAGYVFGEKWAKAAGLRATAERILCTNPQMARIALTEAAEIFETIGKVDLAANCFIALKEYEKAGTLYLEKCGTSRLEDAGDCFALAGCWSDAAGAYAKGKCVHKCLSACTKGEFFNMGLQFIEHWTSEGSSHGNQVDRSEEFDRIKDNYLESCAGHYHKLSNTKLMMKFVRAFSSTDLIRTFLRSENYFDELMMVEEESGNFMEAAKIARMQGNLLVETEMLEKGGQFENASRLVLFHIVITSLWEHGSEGWPLKKFGDKEKLLTRAKLIAMKSSSFFYDSVCAETNILSDLDGSLQYMMEQLNNSQRFRNLRVEIFAARKILDVFLSSAPSKFHQDSEMILNLKNYANEMTSRNSFSVSTLVYFWNLWKEKVLNVLMYLRSLETNFNNGYEEFGEFCLEYLGVRKQDQNVYLVLNQKASWIKSINSSSCRRDEKNLVSMTIPQFVLNAKYYWNLELFSVGMKVLERLEGIQNFYNQNSVSQFCQGLVVLRIFEVSKFLIESEFPDLKNHSGKLQKSLETSKRDFFDTVFPLDWRRTMKENMIALRENGSAGKMLEEILIENLVLRRDQFLTHGQISRVAMLLFVSEKKQRDELSNRIMKCLDQIPAWKEFFDEFRNKEEVSLVCKFQEALSYTFQIDWLNETDYVSPYCFIYLLERLLFLASSCQGWGGCFYTTKSSTVEAIVCKDLCSKHSVGPFQSSISKAFRFIAETIQTILFDKPNTYEWIKRSGINPSKHYQLLVLRLTVAVGLVYLNSGSSLELLQKILDSRFGVNKDLNSAFSVTIRSALMGQMNNKHYFLKAFADALTKIDDPLVVVCMEKKRSDFSNLNAFFLTPVVIQSRDDVLRVLFSERIEADRCKDNKLEQTGSLCRTELPPSQKKDSDVPHGSNSSEKESDDLKKEHGDHDLQRSYSHFWQTFNDFQEEENGEYASKGRFTSNSKCIKGKVKECINVLDAAIASSNKKTFPVCDGDLLRELKSMLNEVKQLSMALDISKDDEDNNSVTQQHFTKLRERRPRLEPLMDSIFSPNDQNSQQQSFEANVASGNQSEGEMEQENDKSSQGKEEGEESTTSQNDRNTGEQTSQVKFDSGNQSKGKKGKGNNKSRQHKKNKNKR